MNFPAIGVDVSCSLDSKRLFTNVAVGLSF
jgi:hypothetical protein